MNVKSRQYDRVLLIEIDGPVSEPELAQLAGYLNTVASRIAAVVMDVQRAELPPAVVTTVMKLKKQYERSKIKFLIVSTDIIGADKAGLAAAVESLKTAESAKIMEIFALEGELKKARDEIMKAQAEVAARLGVAPGADGLDAALRALEEKNRQLRLVFKAFAAEIHQLEGEHEVKMPGSDNPDAVRVAERKLRALDTIKASGALE